MKVLSVVSVAKYLLTHIEPDKGETISPIQLQCLLYFAQKSHIYQKLRPLFYESIVRRDTIPMVVQVWDLHKRYGQNSIDIESEYLDYGEIDNKTKRFLDFIYKKYSRLSAKALYAKTMRQIEVQRAEPGCEISFDVMYSRGGSLPVSFSLDPEFKQIYTHLLPLIKKFKVKHFAIRRLHDRTIDVWLVSKKFEGRRERDNVRALVDFTLDSVPELHNQWIVMFRPRGLKNSR